MSDSEIESRTKAVGRKRNVHGELKTPSYPTSRRSSKASSKESGEISSSSESGSEDEAEAPNKRSRPSPGNTAITISSSSEDGEVSESHEDSSSSSDEAQKRPHSDMNMSSADDSDSDSDSNFSHGISKMASEAADMIRLHQLSKNDRADQKFYFNLTSPNDFVYCLCCGERGHMRATCPERKCSHCGAFESHISSACPKYRKCGRCRQRGHDSRDCRNISSNLTENDPCDICGETGHIEETCSRLWCFPTITPSTASFQKISEQAMLRGCYSCGSGEHWGDDCRYVRRDDLNSVKTWSARNAEKFILGRTDENDDDEYEPPQPNVEEDDEDDDPLAALESGLREGSGEYVEAEDSDEEYEPAPAAAAPMNRPWQMGLFDDARD